MPLPIEFMQNPEDLAPAVRQFLGSPNGRKDLIRFLASKEKLHLFSVYRLQLTTRKLGRLNLYTLYLLVLMVHIFIFKKHLFPDSFSPENIYQIQFSERVGFGGHVLMSSLSIISCLTFRFLYKSVLRNTIRNINYYPKSRTFEIEQFGRGLSDTQLVLVNPEDTTATSIKDNFLKFQYLDETRNSREMVLSGLFLSKTLIPFLTNPENADAIAQEALKMGRN